MDQKIKVQRLLARQLWEAKSADQVEQALALLGKSLGPVEWRPVGDNEDNIAAIHATSDAAVAAVERFTNGIDAVLELAARLQYGDDFHRMARELKSPRLAAERLMGVPVGGITAMSNKERQALAEKVTGLFVSSGVEKRPTFVLTDLGIGQTPKCLPATILSIHRGNKKGKPYLMGVYGWGGSNTLGFAKYTVIISRRHRDCLDGDPDGIAVTTVRKRFDKETMSVPTYEYAVDSNREVFSLDPDALPDFEHGTRIAHVQYDLGKSGSLLDMYNFFNTALFDPVLPVRLGSHVGGKKHTGNRTVPGVRNRIDATDDDDRAIQCIYSNVARIDLEEDEGSVDLRVSVLDKDGARPNDKVAESYISADNTVVLTLSGQRQDSEPRTALKNRAKFPHLCNRMIVQVVADPLEPEAKANMFASTREKMRGSATRDRILSRVFESLQNDEDLQRLEDELREKALSETAEKASARDLEKLAKAIGRLGGRTKEKTVEVDVEVDRNGEKRERGKPGKPRNTDDSHLPEVPTKLEFAVEEMEIEQGGRKRRLIVNLDAKNNYLPDHEDDLSITVVGPQGDTRDVYPHTRSALRGGQAQWLVEAAPAAQPGTYKLEANLHVGEDVLHDGVTITVVKAKVKREGGQRVQIRGKTIVKQKQKHLVLAGPNVTWVKNGQQGLDETDVGKVDESQKGVDIYLNQEYVELNKVLQSRKLSPGQRKRRKSRYMVPVALGLYRIHEAEEEMGEETPKALQQAIADCVLLAVDEDNVLAEDY